MFTNSIKSLVIAGTLAVGALSATSGAANAGGVRIDIGAPGVHFSIGGHGPRYGRYPRPGYHRTCRPAQALRKARRNGVRRAHIVRYGRHGVVVKGRKWGSRITMGFGSHRSCPVRFVRR